MNATTRIELLLFLLARDHLPVGILNQIMIDIDNVREHTDISYEGDGLYLGQWAAVKAHNLLSE